MLDRRAPTNWTRQVYAVKRRAIPCRRPRPPAPTRNRLGWGQLRLGAHSKTAICRDVQCARIKIVATQAAAAHLCWESAGVRCGGPSSGRRHRAEPNEAVFGHELGELAPLHPGFLDDDLLGLGSNPGGRGGCVRSRGPCAAASPLRGALITYIGRNSDNDCCRCTYRQVSVSKMRARTRTDNWESEIERAHALSGMRRRNQR